MAKKRKKKSKRGPVAERLKVQGAWRDAVRKALKKQRPPEGWPTEPKPSAE
jgi:hypothetical protein